MTRRYPDAYYGPKRGTPVTRPGRSKPTSPVDGYRQAQGVEKATLGCTGIALLFWPASIVLGLIVMAVAR